VVEQRRHQRAAIDVPVELASKGSNERVAGRAKDISVGGMLVRTDHPLPFSAELLVHVTLPGQKTPFALPAVVRWAKADSMGVQFKMLGARETHAITVLFSPESS
jgi:hypothetical protein